MKKQGFTLAEVLITLGIIGVVAALSAPALVQNTGNAKVGPTLSKTVSTIELANEQIMDVKAVINLRQLADRDAFGITYMNLLAKQMKNSSVNEETTYTPANVEYNATSQSASATLTNPSLDITNGVNIMFATSSEFKNYSTQGSYLGEVGIFDIDINGTSTGPNRYGKDIFSFSLDANGSVIPLGSKALPWIYENEQSLYSTGDWRSTNTDMACNGNNIGNGKGCAGSVFENNLKVIYQ